MAVVKRTKIVWNGKTTQMNLRKLLLCAHDGGKISQWSKGALTVLCNPCTTGHFESTRKKTMLIFADYTFRGWPLIHEKCKSFGPYGISVFISFE